MFGNLALLRSSGIAVRTIRGKPGAAFGGLQHSKTLLCTSNSVGTLIAGFTNWTVASGGNWETSVLVELTPHGHSEATELFEQRFGRASEFTG